MNIESIRQNKRGPLLDNFHRDPRSLLKYYVTYEGSLVVSISTT